MEKKPGNLEKKPGGYYPGSKGSAIIGLFCLLVGLFCQRSRAL
jgi:hypothetical protein